MSATGNDAPSWQALARVGEALPGGEMYRHLSDTDLQARLAAALHQASRTVPHRSNGSGPVRPLLCPELSDEQVLARLAVLRAKRSRGTYCPHCQAVTHHAGQPPTCQTCWGFAAYGAPVPRWPRSPARRTPADSFTALLPPPPPQEPPV